MRGDSLQDVVASALNSSDAIDIMESIKDAVISEIEQLDPVATIKKTDYFNHSYAPDLVLSWNGKQDREIYLRYSLKSTQAAHDVENLGKSGPVFFSLDSGHDDVDSAKSIVREVERSPNTLVTNVSAIGGFEEAASTSGESVSRPLLDLFRRNVVRGGRGLLVSETANQIQRVPTSDDIESENLYLNDFERTVARVFREDAALRLRRAVSLIRIARSGDASLFDQVDADTDMPVPIPRGLLDTDELRVLLPYLLKQARIVNEERFWRHLGSLMTLKQVEQVSDQLAGLDLSELVRANLDNWRAVRSIVTFNADSIDRDEPLPAEWSISSKMLCAAAGAWKVHFTTDKRRGNSRDESLLARLTELRPWLEGVNLTSIDLQGAVRRVSISGDGESNVLADADSIRGSIDDEFRVRQLGVRPSDEDSSDVTVDFRHLVADGSDVAIGDLAEMSFKILGYRYPISAEDEIGLFGGRASHD